jgi:hypothetical protein
MMASPCRRDRHQAGSPPHVPRRLTKYHTRATKPLRMARHISRIPMRPLRTNISSRLVLLTPLHLQSSKSSTIKFPPESEQHRPVPSPQQHSMSGPKSLPLSLTMIAASTHPRMPPFPKASPLDRQWVHTFHHHLR